MLVWLVSWLERRGEGRCLWVSLKLQNHFGQTCSLVHQVIVLPHQMNLAFFKHFVLVMEALNFEFYVLLAPHQSLDLLLLRQNLRHKSDIFFLAQSSDLFDKILDVGRQVPRSQWLNFGCAQNLAEDEHMVDFLHDKIVKGRIDFDLELIAWVGFCVAAFCLCSERVKLYVQLVFHLLELVEQEPSCPDLAIHPLTLFVIILNRRVKITFKIFVVTRRSTGLWQLAL